MLPTTPLPSLNTIDENCMNAVNSMSDISTASPVLERKGSDQNEAFDSSQSSPSSYTSPVSRKRRVSFSQDVKIHTALPREELLTTACSPLWWSRSELALIGDQACVAVQETIQKNPSLTPESAMCLLYQTSDMFSSRVRLLIADNDPKSAGITRSRIVDAHRLNIWTVQCCSLDALHKVVELGALVFDVILINFHAEKGERMRATDLSHLVHKQWGQQAILGMMSAEEKVSSEDENDSQNTAIEGCPDFYWRCYPNIESKESRREQDHFSRLLSHRRSLEEDKETENANKLRKVNDEESTMMMFSFPSGFQRINSSKLMQSSSPTK